MKKILIILTFLLIVPYRSILSEEKTNVIQLESKRERFVDHYLIHSLDGTYLVLQKTYVEWSFFKFDNHRKMHFTSEGLVEPEGHWPTDISGNLLHIVLV